VNNRGVAEEFWRGEAARSLPFQVCLGRSGAGGKWVTKLQLSHSESEKSHKGTGGQGVGERGGRGPKEGCWGDYSRPHVHGQLPRLSPSPP
jgi:hypothetical protein